MDDEKLESTQDIVETTTVEDYKTPTAYAIYDRASRLKTNSMQPDFTAPKVKTTDMIFKDSVVQLEPEQIEDLVRNSGIKGNLGEQAAVAMENALIDYNSMEENLTLSGGNTINYITGNTIGDEWRDVGYEAMAKRKELMQINEESVGGVRNYLAKLAGGVTSMGQMALEAYATMGYLPLAKMAVQAYGEGTYNDLKKYADEHDGSLEGYEASGIDLAVNTANGFLQAYIERKLGVASPRFFTGWSRGLWKEAAGGFLQESSQSALMDIAEVAKGNQDVSILLDNAFDYLMDGAVGAPLQGALGAVTSGQARARADAMIARARAISQGRKTPNKEDFKLAKQINDAKERELASVLSTEFKAAFDAKSGEGQLQQNIVKALNNAVKSKELDLGTDSETDMAQKIENIATQETLNAMEDALEKGESVHELGINNIVYKDGAIWIEGLTPELGEKAVDYARVLAERQSGLADAQLKLDNLSQEAQQIKKDIAEAKAANQQARVDMLQARLDKQNTLLEKRNAKIEQLREQTEKIQKQIENTLKKQPAKPNKPAIKVADVNKKTTKYKGEKKYLKSERNKQKLTDAVLNQSSVEGKGSDRNRGSYDDRLKRIILNDKSDLTTIQHEFAHYWIQNNFKWARSGLASTEWLRKWRNVEEALGIEARDRYLSKQASEQFAKAYERYIMEGKVSPDLQWAFDGFQKFYNETYEDVENEYFDLNEELNPAIVDWFNRQRPASEESLKQQAYKTVATVAMAQGADIATPVGDGQYVVSSMNENGEVQSDIVVTDDKAKDSKLAKFSDKKKQRSVIEGLRESNENIKSEEYNVLNRAETVEQAEIWIENDRNGAWNALNDENTNIIDRTALFQAFKQLAENGDYALGAELANTKFPQSMTEIGQALSILGERAEFDPLTILETKQKSLGEPTVAELSTQIAEMNLDAELDADQVKELEQSTECVL